MKKDLLHKHLKTKPWSDGSQLTRNPFSDLAIRTQRIPLEDADMAT